MPSAFFTQSSPVSNTSNSDWSPQSCSVTYPQARLASNGNRPIKIVKVRMNLAGRNANRTARIQMTGSYNGEVSFSVSAGTSASNTGFKDINVGASTTPVGRTVNLFVSGLMYIGTDNSSGNNFLGTSGQVLFSNRGLFGEYQYVQVPATPSTPSISANRDAGTVTVSWNAISDWGDSSSNLGYKVEILQNGSLYTSGTTTSTSLAFSVPANNNYSARVYAYNELISFNGSPTSTASGTSSSVTLSAPIVNYTVSFNSDGGSINPASQSVQSGNTIPLPSPGTRSGFSFNGWISSYNGQIYQVNQASHAIFANTTFTASWTQLTWTVFFNGNGGTTPPSQTVNRGSAITLPNSTRSGFTLLGWYTSSVGGSSVGNAGQSYIPSSDITLFAQWQELAPGFTDEIVSGRVPININFNTVADNRVVATNAASYSLISAGGTFPTWLSINNSGFLSGSTNVVGPYTFRVRATSSTGQTADSNIITITVFHPGKRYNAATASNIEFSNGAFRRDSSGAFVPLTTMKRYNGTSWVDISN
jgi:hypothetical protein